ncbi:MAG: ACT domain-containing protein [Planctomycetaceae bacterium]|nr:ACT domain-containing protein [Planctomycetaceae bacterium]
MPIKDLNQLLASLQPVLSEQECVFITLAYAQYGDAAPLQPIASVAEPEGLTLVVPRRLADQQGHAYQSVFRCLTLNVNSDLQAVGLTAAVATALAQHSISANVVAGFHHDHIFVPSAAAAHALTVLQELSARYQ